MAQSDLTSQNLIRDLRAELYSTRSAHKEAKSQAESLRVQLSALQQSVQQERQTSRQVPTLKAELHAKQEVLDRISQEAKQLRDAREGAEQDLRDARSRLEKAENGRDRVEAERLRLHRMRDENAHQLLEAQARIQELEEEQSRLEEMHHAEISTLASSKDVETPRATVGDNHDNSTALQELQMERQRAEGLSVALETAKRQRDEAVAGLQRHEREALRPDSPDQAAESGQENATPLQVLRETSASGLEELQARIIQLSAVRDKLMQELDLQVEETERLASENASITQAMLNARKVSNAWEAQTNDSLIQIDKLKDMLEESAMWRGHSRDQSKDPSPGNGFPPQQDSSKPVDAKAGNDMQSAVENLEKQLLLAKAQGTELETHLRSLTMELNRQAAVTNDVKNWSLPLLSSIEKQLHSLVKVTAPSLFVGQTVK